MKPIPISEDWIDPRTLPDKKLSGLARGAIIGLIVVFVFWALVFIIAGAMLVLH